jgi:hypothetical protein
MPWPWASRLGLPAHDDGFALLLGLFDSTITYRAQFQARREVPPLLHLLAMDTDNPRSWPGWPAPCATACASWPVTTHLGLSW